MLLNLLRATADLVALVTRLTTGELADDQRMALIDQFIRLQRLDAAFQFDLHDLLIILTAILINIFGRAWNRVGRWPYR